MWVDLSFGIHSFLTLIGFAQTDNPAHTIPINKYDNKKAMTDVTNAYHAIFSILVALVWPRNGGIPFKLTGISKRYSMLVGVDGILIGVKYDFHGWL